MYSTRAIANYLLDKGYGEGVSVTPFKINKLSYLAHGWYLALTIDALSNETVEAWEHGPVFPSLYYEFKKYGRFPIDEKAKEWRGINLVTPTVIGEPENKSFPTQTFLDTIWQVYKSWSVSDLHSLTHENGSPWHTVKYSAEYRGRRDIIDDELIYKYFRKKLDELKQE